MGLVDCLKQVLDPTSSPNEQSQELELVERQGKDVIMKVLITGTGGLVWAMRIMAPKALNHLSSLKGKCKKRCDYLIVVQSDGTDYVVFVEMKKTLNEGNKANGMEQLRRSLPLWDYLLSVCKIECEIAPDVSVKYVLIAEAEKTLDLGPTYPAIKPEVLSEPHRGISGLQPTYPAVKPEGHSDHEGIKVKTLINEELVFPIKELIR